MRPRPKVRQLLDTCRLNDYFKPVFRLEEVEEIAAKLDLHGQGGTRYRDGVLTLKLPVELTAATLPDFKKDADRMQQELKEGGMLKTIYIDAAPLEFIDSSGLGFLIALKKSTQDDGVRMSVENVAEKARRVFEVARVDSVLLNAWTGALFYLSLRGIRVESTARRLSSV